MASFSAAFDRPALTIETGQFVYDRIAPLETRLHEIAFWTGFDFDRVGKFAARPGMGVPDYQALQQAQLAALDEGCFGAPAVVLVDHAPGFLRAPAIAFFAERAEYVIVHDAEHVEHYHLEPHLSRFRSRWDFRLHRPTSVILSNRHDCRRFAYLDPSSVIATV